MNDSSEGYHLPFSRPPILLIGSGITKRYSDGAQDWMGLLDAIGKRVGIDRDVMMPLIRKSKKTHDESLSYLPKLASLMSDHLDEMLRTKEISIENILNTEDLDLYYEGNIDPIKILAAYECRGITIKDDEVVKEEINCLRSLSDNIPCIITTNYDTMLEDIVFEGRFKPYSRISEYYLSGSQGIGEIYKIHGTCSDPSTMILNEEDYLSFSKNAKIISAKILSILCDYPMLVMGYSMEDSDIRCIMNDLISSLDDDKLSELERNILYVAYDEGNMGFTESKMSFEFEGRRMIIPAIKTDNFSVIFKELSSMEPSVSPQLVRRLRQIIRNLCISEGTYGNRLKIVGIDDVDDDADKYVITITDHAGSKVIDMVQAFMPDGLLKDVLSDRSVISPDSFVALFYKHGGRMYQKNRHSCVPLYEEGSDTS